MFFSVKITWNLCGTIFAVRRTRVTFSPRCERAAPAEGINVSGYKETSRQRFVGKSETVFEATKELNGTVQKRGIGITVLILQKLRW